MYLMRVIKKKRILENKNPPSDELRLIIEKNYLNLFKKFKRFAKRIQKKKFNNKPCLI